MRLMIVSKLGQRGLTYLPADLTGRDSTRIA